MLSCRVDGCPEAKNEANLFSFSLLIVIVVSIFRAHDFLTASGVAEGKGGVGAHAVSCVQCARVHVCTLLRC